MAYIVALGVVAFLLLAWVGRRRRPISEGARLASALFAALAAVGAVVSAAKGNWMASLALVAASAWLAQRARQRIQRRVLAGRGGMSAQEARTILGVSEQASRADITSAHRRLIRRAHPDQGGATEQAARLNAARDRLVGKGSAG